eukprot:2351351-Amphidinium_carterae.1
MSNISLCDDACLCHQQSVKHDGCIDNYNQDCGNVKQRSTNKAVCCTPSQHVWLPKVEANAKCDAKGLDSWPDLAM